MAAKSSRAPSQRAVPPVPGEVADDGDAGWRHRVVGRSLGPAADRAVERGQALISAASRLVQESGEDFTMQRVASEAGLSLRAIYQYFSGKDDLLVALIEEAQGVFVRLIRRRVEEHTDPLERLGAALYFMTDPRQHTEHDYNVALLRFTLRTSLTEPDQVGRARRPVVTLLAALVADAMDAGELERGDPEVAAGTITLAYHGYQMNTNLGNTIGGPLPTNDRFVRFCLLGLGAELPAGWEERLHVSEEEADLQRQESERLAGTKRPAKRGRQRASS